jgi:hypothetical protein
MPYGANADHQCGVLFNYVQLATETQANTRNHKCLTRNLTVCLHGEPGRPVPFPRGCGLLLCGVGLP